MEIDGDMPLVLLLSLLSVLTVVSSFRKVIVVVLVGVDVVVEKS
jgi:hypothetical protein